MKNTIADELVRICYMMDINCLTFSFGKEEWISIGKIFLELIVNRFKTLSWIDIDN